MRILIQWLSVDENLFYKGVDKSAVHGARLSQTSSLSDPLLNAPPLHGAEQGARSDPDHLNEATPGEQRPPYPFKSGNDLLALTKNHNVSASLYSKVKGTYEE